MYLSVLEQANKTNLQSTRGPMAQRRYLLRLQEEALEVVEGDPLFWSVDEPVIMVRFSEHTSVTLQRLTVRMSSFDLPL